MSRRPKRRNWDIPEVEEPKPEEAKAPIAQPEPSTLKGTGKVRLYGIVQNRHLYHTVRFDVPEETAELYVTKVHAEDQKSLAVARASEWMDHDAEAGKI